MQKGGRRDHWREPRRVREGSETPNRVTCERQVRTRPAVSCADRQGVARRLSRRSLEAVRRNGGSAGCGRRDLRGHRDLRRGALAWGTGAGSEGRDLHTEAGAAGSDPEEAARQVLALGHPLRTGASVRWKIGSQSVGRRADWTPIGALTSCFLLTHRGQHRALNNTDRRGNPLIWLDCGGQQSVLDNKPGCTRWRARSGSRHGRRERDLAGGVGAARPVSIAVSMTFPMRSAAASTSRSLTWA